MALSRRLARPGVYAAACAAVACVAPARAHAPVDASGQAPQAQPVVAEAGPAVRDIRIVATGDLLVHQPVWARALANGNGRYRFQPMFRAIRPRIRGADLAICHMETPLGPGAPSGYPVFNTPPALATAIKRAGWDVCTTASNHSVDQGQAGVRSTIRALRRAGLRHTGTARSRRESRRILLVDVKGIRVAILAATYGTNGIPMPHPWSVMLIRPKQIIARARRARRLGADLVILNLHWGAEYVHTPTAAQRAIARRLRRSGAVDLIVGQHAHVVQPIRRLRGRFVVYGEGNFLSAQSSSCCPGPTQDGLAAVARVRVSGDRVSVTRVNYVPIYVRRPDFVALPVGHRLRRLAAAGASGSAEAVALRASWRRTVGVVGRTRLTRPLPR
jgi:poly-gamma-glutamate capsule biosynthesis protein CapA/YwtB (metallophosphatase superfamily)